MRDFPLDIRGIAKVVAALIAVLSPTSSLTLSKAVSTFGLGNEQINEWHVSRVSSFLYFTERLATIPTIREETRCKILLIGDKIFQLERSELTKEWQICRYSINRGNGTFIPIMLASF